jgi:sulfite reductase alpha subunit-like flavoprotein
MKEDLYDYCHKVRRTTLEVLTEFTSVKLPLNYLFDALPALRQRQFSIASSVSV